MGAAESVLVTGVSGNLGSRLLPLLADYHVVGVDLRPPANSIEMRFTSLDLGEESSCHKLVELLRETCATQVVHLAFVLDPQGDGDSDVERMWQINVAGTARVMEAITETNRLGGNIRKFIYPSSVAAYGSDTPGPVTETHPLNAHTLPYAIHKKEADEVVRYRADSLGDCSVYLLRPHIFTGAMMQNHFVGALQGTPTGKSARAERWRAAGKRLPLMLPFGKSYPEKKVQFIHVDDMARLLAFLLHHEEPKQATHIFNVAAHGEPLTLQQCVEIAKGKIMQVPGKWACRMTLRRLWNLGITAVPPDALPYLIGSYTMDTSRLKKFLGEHYREIIQHDVASALSDSFRH